jgi:hypothetical protein
MTDCNASDHSCGFMGLRFCTYQCWTFFVSCLITFIALGICLMGLFGIFPTIDPSNCWNLLTFVVGVWMPSPRLKPMKKDENKEKKEANNGSTHTSVYDTEDEDEEGELMEVIVESCEV